MTLVLSISSSAREEAMDPAVALGREIAAADQSYLIADRSFDEAKGSAADRRMKVLLRQMETTQSTTLAGALAHIAAASDPIADLCDNGEDLEPNEVVELAQRAWVLLWRIRHAIEGHTDARIEDLGGTRCMRAQLDPTRSEPMPAVETPVQEAAE